MRLAQPWILGTFYACSELILAAARRSRSSDRSRDRSSLPVLWIVIVLAIFVSVAVANAAGFARLPDHNLTLVGVIVFGLGILLRWYSVFYLGRFFTVDVSIAREHSVIDSGPYRFVRHPSYSGALLAFLGFGLCLHNWLSLLVLIVPITAAFFWRIHVEERALSEALGEEYRRYASRTKRLIPFLY